MFKILVTSEKRSTVGAGVAICSTELSFDTHEKAERAYNKLMNVSTRIAKPAWSGGTVEKLYE